MEPMKIYAFCNIPHTREEEYQIKNHPIMAVNKHGEYVAHWVSSNHGFGKSDIEVGIYKSDKIQLPIDIEWVDDPQGHPELSRILKLNK
jgi:hypothetical protein